MDKLVGGASTGNAKNGDLLSYADRLKRLALLLNSVDVAVYPVDPRGLGIDAQYDASFDRSGNRGSARLDFFGENAAGTFATMDLIAAETGGRAFYNANALGESIQESVDDSRMVYALAFYSDERTWDGKSHRLEVHVDRPALRFGVAEAILSVTRLPSQESNERQRFTLRRRIR